MINAIRRTVLVLISLTVFWSCSDGTSPEKIDGVYTLVSIDGQPVPVILSFENYSWQKWNSGTLELNGSVFTFTYDMNERESDEEGYYWTDDPIYSVTGSFILEGSNFTLTSWDWEESISATWNGGNEVTLTAPYEEEGAKAFLFRRTN